MRANEKPRIISTEAKAMFNGILTPILRVVTEATSRVVIAVITDSSCSYTLLTKLSETIIKSLG